VQIYLSINRPDLAKKEFEKSKRWAEDDLLLQLIESSIGLVTGKDAYSDSNSFYTEQLANPSLSSPHLLTARGITRLLKGEIDEAKSDLEESVTQGGGDAEAIAAYTVAAGLKSSRKGEAEEWWRSEIPLARQIIILKITSAADSPRNTQPTLSSWMSQQNRICLMNSHPDSKFLHFLLYQLSITDSSLLSPIKSQKVAG
jgi:hypothetical protein